VVRGKGGREKEETMRARIDEDACIGCGVCADMCPEVFELQDEIAVVRIVMIPGNMEDCAEEAAEECPVEAIELD